MSHKEALLTNGNQKMIYVIHVGFSGSRVWRSGYLPGTVGCYSKTSSKLPDLGMLYTYHRNSPDGTSHTTYSEANPKGFYTRLDTGRRGDFSSGRYEGYFFNKDDNGKDIQVLYEPLKE